MLDFDASSQDSQDEDVWAINDTDSDDDYENSVNRISEQGLDEEKPETNWVLPAAIFSLLGIAIATVVIYIVIRLKRRQ